MISVLSQRWESKNLVFQKLSESEITEVQHLYEGSQYINKWDGNEYNPHQIEQWYNFGDLPPEGVKENYSLYTVRHIDGNELLGVLSVYHGYPHVHSAYVVFLYVNIEQQQQGFGREAENQLSNEMKTLGYKEIRANVSVRNWPAIRFWIKAGFNTIGGIYGDRVHAENTFANLELIKKL